MCWRRVRLACLWLVAVFAGLLLASPVAVAVVPTSNTQFNDVVEAFFHAPKVASPDRGPTPMRGAPADHVQALSVVAIDLESRGTAASSGWARASASPTYDDQPLTLRGALVAGPIEARRTWIDAGTFPSASRSGVAANTGTELRKVGSVLESVDDVMANPSLLKGQQPKVVESALKGTPSWQVEKLGRGSQVGNGWVFRQYTPAGNPTGQQLRWHPGGGHHGPDPYWRVIGPNGDLGGVIR